MPRSSVPRVQPARSSHFFPAQAKQPAATSTTVRAALYTPTRKASERTFACFNLLELILLRLADDSPHNLQPTLFVLQRVNRAFRHVITESQPLRRCMHLLHSEDDETNVARLESLRGLGILPDFTIHIDKQFGPYVRLLEGPPRPDSGVGFACKRYECESYNILGAAAQHKHASWRHIRVPTRWRGQELMYGKATSSKARDVDVSFWLRSGCGEATAGDLFNQIKEISGLNDKTALSLASYSRSNVTCEVLRRLRRSSSKLWREHRAGMCGHFADCIFCRAQRLLHALPHTVEWSLNSSQCNLLHKSTHIILDQIRCSGATSSVDEDE